MSDHQLRGKFAELDLGTEATYLERIVVRRAFMAGAAGTMLLLAEALKDEVDFCDCLEDIQQELEEFSSDLTSGLV